VAAGLGVGLGTGLIGGGSEGGGDGAQAVGGAEPGATARQAEPVVAGAAGAEVAAPGAMADAGAGAGEAAPAVVDSSDPVREAEAAVAWKLLESELGAVASAPARLLQLRSFASAFVGTAAGREAAAAARALAAEIDATLASVRQQTGAILREAGDGGDFASAASRLGELLRERAAAGGAGEREVRGALDALEARCRERWRELEGIIVAHAEDERFEEALELGEAFAGRATPGVRALVEARLGDVRATFAGEIVASTLDRVEALVAAAFDGGPLEDALAAVDEALGTRALEDARPRLQTMRAELVAGQRAASGLRDALDRLVGGGVTALPLLIGETVEGQVRGVDMAAHSVAFAERGTEQVVALTLGELSPAYLSELVGCGPGAESEERLAAGVCLLRAGASQGGSQLLRGVAEAGRGLSEPLLEALARAEAGILDARAEAHLARARALLDTERYAPAVEALRPLMQELARTGFVKRHRDEVRETYIAARSEVLLEAGVEQFFAGDVQDRGRGRVRIHYRFEDAEELNDFTPVVIDAVKAYRESSVRRVAGYGEFKGRVVWRGQVRGDVSVDLALPARRNQRNVNVVLYDTGLWDGWLCGLRMDAEGNRTYMTSPNAPLRPNWSFKLPAHVVARLGGTPRDTEFLFAAKGPPIPVAKTPARFSVRSRKLTLSMGGAAISPSIPVPADETHGGITLLPGEDALRLLELRISGTIDPAWLEEEARRRAATEVDGALAKAD
jgi:hypothetical protein